MIHTIGIDIGSRAVKSGLFRHGGHGDGVTAGFVQPGAAGDIGKEDGAKGVHRAPWFGKIGGIVGLRRAESHGRAATARGA